MSRIGRKVIVVPKEVKVNFDKQKVTVTGAKGALSVEMDHAITHEFADNEITLKRESDHKRNRSLHGLYRAMIQNMITGVTKGFTKELLIDGVGYKATLKGKTLVLDLGFSHQIEYQPPQGITIKCPQPTQVVVEGADRQVVGQVAADIRAYYKPEPYKGKGIRYKEEYVRRKQGKKVG